MRAKANIQSETDVARKFTSLMREGQLAFNAWNNKRAHLLWRRAASLKPGEEQAWLALMNVVESDEDRRVCLKNILTINPNNVQAQRRLVSLENPAESDKSSRMPENVSRHYLSLLIELLLIGIGSAIIFALLLTPS